MHHDTDLINIVAVGLGLAFIFGALANKLRLSPLVGYLVAGICVGPFTPASSPTRRWPTSWPNWA